jgi:hypothetical protein
LELGSAPLRRVHIIRDFGEVGRLTEDVCTYTITTAPAGVKTAPRPGSAAASVAPVATPVVTNATFTG